MLHGGVTAGSLNVTGESTLLSNVTMGSNVVVNGPSLKIPVGNISARPTTPQDGYIRYNSEIQQFEGYGPGSAWGSLGGVVDIAQTTKILASETPSVTDGNLYFYTVGSERMRVNSSGNIGVGTSAPAYKLDVQGTLGVSIGLTTGSILSTSVSSGQIDSTNATMTNIVATNLSSGNFVVTDLLATNITASNILVNTQVSSASLYAPLATISNIVATATSTGSLNVTGITVGSILANTVDITPSLGDISKEVSFSAANNQSSSANVTGLAFPNAIVRSFNAVVSVSVLSSNGNLYANYDIRGVQKDSGDWAINAAFVGDNTGYVFTIDNVNSKGQIKYTSTNVSGWSSTTIKFRAHTTSA
jgi:hypothetical protein